MFKTRRTATTKHSLPSKEITFYVSDYDSELLHFNPEAEFQVPKIVTLFSRVLESTNATFDSEEISQGNSDQDHYSRVQSVLRLDQTTGVSLQTIQQITCKSRVNVSRVMPYVMFKKAEELTCSTSTSWICSFRVLKNVRLILRGKDIYSGSFRW